MALTVGHEAASTEVVLPKGKSIEYLDYIITNSPNEDGLVLSKPTGVWYECHLGNFGTGTADNLNNAKRYALIHYMLARPILFAVVLANKVATFGSGTTSEYYTLTHAIRNDGLTVPPEVTISDDAGGLIWFSGAPLTKVII
jgi:hypothetical protein